MDPITILRFHKLNTKCTILHILDQMCGMDRWSNILNIPCIGYMDDTCIQSLSYQLHWEYPPICTIDLFNVQTIRIHNYTVLLKAVSVSLCVFVLQGGLKVLTSSTNTCCIFCCLWKVLSPLLQNILRFTPYYSV